MLVEQNRHAKALSPDEQASLDRQAAMLKALVRLPTHEAAGVACSVLLHVGTHQPEVLRRLLNEQVIKEGFRGTSLLTVLTRAAR
jgi:hypothetical protein